VSASHFYAHSDIFIEYQTWLPAAARGQDSATKVGNKLKDFFKKEKGHTAPMEEDHLRLINYYEPKVLISSTTA
jgi:hypothetical protein